MTNVFLDLMECGENGEEHSVGIVFVACDFEVYGKSIETSLVAWK